jgi:hypothetical protein
MPWDLNLNMACPGCCSYLVGKVHCQDHQNSPEKIELRKVVEISVLQLLKGIEGRLLIERYAVEATLLIEGTPLGFNPKEGCLGVKLDLLVS